MKIDFQIIVVAAISATFCYFGLQDIARPKINPKQAYQLALQRINNQGLVIEKNADNWIATNSKKEIVIFDDEGKITYQRGE